MNAVEIIHITKENLLQFLIDITLQIQNRTETKHFTLKINLEDSISQLIKQFESSFDIHLNRLKRKYGFPDKSGSDELERPNIVMKKDDDVLSADLEIKTFLALAAKNDNSLKLEINKDFYIFHYNYPMIVKLTLPSNIMVGFPVFPRKLNILFGYPENAEYKWVDNHNKTLKEDYYYIPTERDAHKRIKLICTPKNNGLIGKEYIVATNFNVTEVPKTYPFHYRQERTKYKLQDQKIRILSYNVLAEKYTRTLRENKVVYPYCERKYLIGDYRNSVLIREIFGYNADLISLQEVEESAYKLYFWMNLSREGYDGRHMPKKGCNEGVASFYRKDRFELLETFDCSLGRDIIIQEYMNNIVEELKKATALFSRVIEHNTVAMALVLKQTDVKDKIVVFVNTHLYYHVDAADIKFIQSFLALMFIQHVVHETKLKHPGKKISVVFGGDFNSVPTSSMYRYYTAKNAEVKTRILKELPDLQGPMWINTRFWFRSACGTPVYTNYVDTFQGCLDYIFYEKDKMKVDEIVPFPPHGVLKKYTGLPSKFFPSDHLALVVNLSWIV